MAYRPYIWRKNNPEKRLEQKRREKVRMALRKKGILPPVGEEMNDEQLLINEQISNNDFTYWDSIKLRTSGSGGIDKQIKVNIQSPEYLLWYRAKQNSKEHNREFNIDIEDIIIPLHCPYLGIELLTNRENCYSHNYYSIDRIDSKKGYVKGNVQVISRLSNTMKSNSTIEELITFSQNVLKMYETQIS
jgi:hypothetical protein